MKLLGFLSFLSVLCFVASHSETDGVAVAGGDDDDIPSVVVGEEEREREENHCYDNCGEEGGFDYYQVGMSNTGFETSINSIQLICLNFYVQLILFNN